MKYSCIHTHTNFCDGKGDVDLYCQRAVEQGLYSLGFSSHAPVTKKTGFTTDWHMKDERLDEYIETVNNAKKKWKGKIKIFLGLEVDYIHGIMGPADRDYKTMGLDYIIGAVHYVSPPKGELFTVDDSPENVQKGLQEGFGGDPDALLNAYWENLEGLIHAGGFDVLAHPDVIKKTNNIFKFFSEESDTYRMKSEKIAAMAGDRGIIIEVNTGGMIRGKTSSPYPSLPFLKKFRKYKVPAIINSDAHNPDVLSGFYDEAIKLLLDADYKETLVLIDKKPDSPVWEKVKL